MLLHAVLSHTLSTLLSVFCFIFCSRLSEKDLPIIWTNLSTAMPQLVTICIYVFTYFFQFRFAA